MKRKSTIFIILIVFSQCWFLFVGLRYPYEGIQVHENMNKQWVIESFQGSPQSVVNQFQTGDIVLSVDNVSPDRYPTIKRWGDIERAHHITVSHNGRRRTATVQNKSMDEIDLFSFFGELIGILFAALIYFKAQRTRSSLLLSFVFMNISLVFMSLPASIRGDVAGKVYISSTVMLLPVLFYHFLIDFFEEKADLFHSKIYVKMMYAVVAASFILEVVFFITPLANLFYRFFMIWLILFFISGIVLNLSFLAFNYFKYRKTHIAFSLIIRMIWISIFVSILPVTLFSFLPQLFFHRAWINAFYTGWFLLLFPITFTYLLLTRKIFDLNMVFKRLLFSALISLVPSILISTVVGTIFMTDLTIRHMLFTVIIVWVMLTIIIYGLEYWMSRLEKVIFPRKYFLKENLKNISQQMISVSSYHELRRKILKEIVSILEVTGGAILIKMNDRWEVLEEGDFPVAIMNYIENEEQIKRLPYHVFDIHRNEEYTSFLVLTDKRNEAGLGFEEREWVEIILSYLAVSLENVSLIQKLTLRLNELAAQIPNELASDDVIWFRKSMFELQEKERYKIASDIHDTTIQDIIFAKRKLEPLLNKFEAGSEEHSQIKGVLKHLEMVNDMLRQTSFEIYPYLLTRIGLNQTIQKIVKMEKGVSEFAIRYSSRGGKQLDKLDIDLQLHLYRMVQELINNAKKHSKAQLVRIKLELDSRNIYLDYSDDGVGFDMEEVVKRSSAAESENEGMPSSGLGILQLKGRVLYLNGETTVQSTVGTGTNIKIRIPKNPTRVFPIYQKENLS